jgi:hypothetical protein
MGLNIDGNFAVPGDYGLIMHVLPGWDKTSGLTPL